MSEVAGSRPIACVEAGLTFHAPQMMATSPRSQLQFYCQDPAAAARAGGGWPWGALEGVDGGQRRPETFRDRGDGWAEHGAAAVAAAQLVAPQGAAEQGDVAQAPGAQLVVHVDARKERRGRPRAGEMFQKAGALEW